MRPHDGAGGGPFPALAPLPIRERQMVPQAA